ncbi:Proprotein convertase P-domain protein [compost metagenome]
MFLCRPGTPVIICPPISPCPTCVTNTATFTNPTPIIIPLFGPATPYPSNIIVSGLTGTISKVTVTLSNFSHSFPEDVDILLVGPNGQRVILMSDAGGDNGITNVTITFDDNAPSTLPNEGQIMSGAFKPTDPFPPPAPQEMLSVFNSTNPNGIWSLFVVDNVEGDQGSIAGGWSLTITTETCFTRFGC